MKKTNLGMENCVKEINLGMANYMKEKKLQHVKS
jgi:hypothetical protein